MGIVTAFAVYFVIWWTVLFAVLPFGVRAQADTGETLRGTADSAPVMPHLVRKMAITTALSAAVFVFYYVATQVYGIGPGSFPKIIPGT